MPPDEESLQLTAPPDEPKNILVAVDASAAVSRVLDMAGRMTRAMPEAVLHVLHVFKASRLDRARAGAPSIDPNAIEEAKDHLAHCVRTLRRRTRSQVVQHFVIGDPASEALRLAAEFDVDLLVVGTHDYGGFERFLLGSVAETLMRKIGCPILIVRPKQHKT